jgi:hypothetical protein
VGGTRILRTGTAGAAGPDNLRAADPPPATAEILYFSPATRRPLAIDRITVGPLESSFSVERVLLPEGETPFRPDPVPVPPELRRTPPTTAGQVIEAPGR